MLFKLLITILLVSCSGINGSQPDNTSSEDGGSNTSNDITDIYFFDFDPDCETKLGSYTSQAYDSTNENFLFGQIFINSDQEAEKCIISSNSIPNHEFNDGNGFSTSPLESENEFEFPIFPEASGTATPLTLDYNHAIFLNGIKLDLLVPACYQVGDEISGCVNMNTPWRIDPLNPNNSFALDSYNARTDDTGTYFYQGPPEAMYDSTGEEESAVIGYAADGFPIYGPFSIDTDGEIIETLSGYSLKIGTRASQNGETPPPGEYDGTYIDDYEFTNSGDLDECNGKTLVDGTYAYFVTLDYPYVIGCFKGTPDPSFMK